MQFLKVVKIDKFCTWNSNEKLFKSIDVEQVAFIEKFCLIVQFEINGNIRNGDAIPNFASFNHFCDSWNSFLRNLLCFHSLAYQWSQVQLQPIISFPVFYRFWAHSNEFHALHGRTFNENQKSNWKQNQGMSAPKRFCNRRYCNVCNLNDSKWKVIQNWNYKWFQTEIRNIYPELLQNLLRHSLLIEFLH